MSNPFRKFIVVDTETSGLETGSRMVELAAVRFDEVGEIDTFNTFVNPGMPIPADVTAIHQITDDMVSDAPDAAAAIEQLAEWIGGFSGDFIAHNAPFDGGIIAWDCARVGVERPFQVITDTVEIARAVGATRRNSLAVLMDHYGIVRAGDAHRALSDARGCAEYYRRVVLGKGIVPIAWDGTDCAPYVAAEDLPEELRDVPDLVTEAAPMTFVYEDAKGDVTERTITPYGWGLSPKGDLMFHGRRHMREARRSFRADRVVSRG